MRKALWPTAGVAGAVIAAACVVSVVAQQNESQPDAPPPSATQRRPPADYAGRPAAMMEPGIPRIEMFLTRPGRVIIRDTYRVGRIDCRPWDNGAAGSPGVLRVNAVVAYAPDRADDRATGAELVLQDDQGDHTFLFDAEQVGDLLVALEQVRTTAETMRDPPQDAGRRAVYNLNGFEIGMAPRRSGGYVAPLGPDEQSVGLNPDNFRDFQRLLTEAQTILKREATPK